MSHRNLLTGLAAGAIMLGLALPVSANEASVSFSLEAHMPSLRDAKRNDTFKVTLSDRQVATSYQLTCKSGGSKWWGLRRTNEACVVTGKGSLIHPSNGQKIHRVDYSGMYTVEAEQDGYTSMSGVQATYAQVRLVPGSRAVFGGSIVMKPENPAPSARQLGALLLRSLEEQAGQAGEQLDNVTAFDAIRFDRFQTPSAGLPEDQGCSWDGDMIYAYANDSWVIDLTANCGGQVTKLQGNMPWNDVEGQQHDAEYALNLSVPSAGASSNDALFTTATSNADLFAQTDGIAGTIRMSQSDFVLVGIEEGVSDELATRINAEGDFVGTGVSLDLVRSFAHMLSMMSRGLFGA